MYHRIADRVPGHPPPTWNVTPARFAWQLRGLLSRGFDAWPLKKVVDYHRCGRMIPRNVFVITFDDGYANFLHQVLPVLQRYRLPATLFLATAHLDSQEPFPFDDWTSARHADVPRESWEPLSTKQCHLLLESGLVELGAHTHTHQDFRGRPEAFRADLIQCVAELRNRFNIESPTFAFPFGSPKLGFASEGLVANTYPAGVTCALTTESKVVLPTDDPFHWGRFTAANGDTPATLAARLNGWNNLLRQCAGNVSALVRRARGRWGK